MANETAVEALLRRAEAVCAASAALRCLRDDADRWQAACAASRPLDPAEQIALETQGNYCEAWDQVRVIGRGDLEAVRQNRFEGPVVLRLGGGAPRLWRSRLRHASVGAAVIEDTTLAERVWVEDTACIRRVTEITGTPGSRFCLGVALHPGSETGARSIWLWDGWSLEDCAAMVALTSAEQARLHQVLAGKLDNLGAGFSWIGPGALVESSGLVTDCFLGPGATIRGAARMTRCIFDSTVAAPSRAGSAVLAEDVVLAPGAWLDSGAQAVRGLLLPVAALERGAHLQDAVLGPCTRAAQGEITASLVGPLVGFHHSSLLIGALWPEGRGNIGYGAMLGSNHTGRQPDQEIRPGEGGFFGLGCAVKFPADFSRAPYSLFATGITTAPQRLTFPFSLIAAPTALAPADAADRNEIFPGWMWSDNLYALLRNAYKFADRNPAGLGLAAEDLVPETSPLAGTFLAAAMFAPRIAQNVRAAWAVLRRAEPGNSKTWYSENDLPGLGRNWMRAERLPRAMAAYAEYLQAAFCRNLLWPAEPSHTAWAGWDDFVPNAFAPESLFAALQRGAKNSLRKDAQRGEKIFDDYAEFHAVPETDPVCLRLRRDCHRLLPILRSRLDALPHRPDTPSV